MMVNGKKIKEKEKENIFIKMEINMKVNGKMERTKKKYGKIIMEKVVVYFN